MTSTSLEYMSRLCILAGAYFSIVRYCLRSYQNLKVCDIASFSQSSAAASRTASTRPRKSEGNRAINRTHDSPASAKTLAMPLNLSLSSS
jgi:hypothetical protein